MALETPPLATVGDNCIDRYQPPMRPDSVGGNALNVAVGFAQAGHPTKYLGAVGNDAEGRQILEAAAAAGVDVSGVWILADPSGVTTVELLPDGDRRFLDESYGASAAYRLDPSGLELLRGHAWVHAANLGGAPAAVRELAAAGHRVSYDFSDHGEAELRVELCPDLTIAFFSAPGVMDAEASSLAETAVGDGAATAVVTRGACGSLALDRDGLHVQEALPTEPIDTLGAGDAFIAAFIVAVVGGAATAEALQRATEAAARTCRIIGPWPVRKEVRV